MEISVSFVARSLIFISVLANWGVLIPKLGNSILKIIVKSAFSDNFWLYGRSCSCSSLHSLDLRILRTPGGKLPGWLLDFSSNVKLYWMKMVCLHGKHTTFENHLFTRRSALFVLWFSKTCQIQFCEISKWTPYNALVSNKLSSDQLITAQMHILICSCVSFGPRQFGL